MTERLSWWAPPCFPDLEEGEVLDLWFCKPDPTDPACQYCPVFREVLEEGRGG